MKRHVTGWVKMVVYLDFELEDDPNCEPAFLSEKAYDKALIRVWESDPNDDTDGTEFEWVDSEITFDPPFAEG